jgi:DNA-binding NtrC family response regulator
LRLPANAALGRRVMAAGVTHELPDERMSRDHATVKWERGIWTVEDLDSRNGTFLDGERVSGSMRRRESCVLRLGHTVFLLLADGAGHPTDGVIGPELERAYAQVRRQATGTVLALEGEPGTGMEAAARLFHDSGPRASGPFVAVSCTTMPVGVAERLIFGARRGAAETIGHVQLAHGGTLFLDEIAHLDGTAQAAVARWLSVPREAGLVVSGQALQRAVTEGSLRHQVLERLGTPVWLPPLRQRRVDLVRIAQRELAPLGAHAKLIESLVLRRWPGNGVELEAALRAAKQAAIEAKREVVRLEDLAETAGMMPGTKSGETAVERKQVKLDQPTIAAAMQRANGAVSVAARALGVHRRQLCKLLDDHGIAYDEE